jgi:hypothetical protein
MPRGPPARLAVAVALLAALAAAVVVRTTPPGPRGVEAPGGEFSAARALETLRALAGEGAPRPVGSAANLRTAEAIAARLRALGLEVDEQDAFACGIYGVCARVRNVLARLGAPGTRSVLLVAHHDSVAAGPGVADDLSGVAIILEVARALAAGPPLPRPFVALVTDAEELGLVGASAFATAHPWAADAGAAVNLEARGTSGPSILFETSGDPAWLGRALRSLPRPVTTSLAPAVYDLLPNDTDLTVLERHGIPGVNLAFAFDVVHYHTPLDDLARLDLRSLQHQGDKALALVRAIAAEELETPSREPFVFFDVLGAAVAVYRHPRAVALGAALAVAIAGFLLLRREPRPARALLWGLAAGGAAPLLAAAAVLGARLALGTGPLPRPFVASPEPFVAAAWAAGAGAALVAIAAAARRAGPAGLFAMAAGPYAILGLVFALALPAGSYVFVLPALAAGIAGVGAGLAAGGPGWLPLASILPGVTAGLVLFPVAYLFPHMLGLDAAAVVAALVALVVLAVAPLGAGPAGRGRWLPGGVALAAALLLAGTQAALPHATADAPERMTIAFHEEDRRARWLLEAESHRLPPALRAEAAFAPSRETLLDWAPERPTFTAPARPLGVPPPRLDVVAVADEDGGRRIRARLVSPRGAPVGFVLFPPDAEIAGFAMEGVPVPQTVPKALRWWGGFRAYACATLPPEGVEIEVRIRGSAPVPFVVLDESRGLPPAGAPLAAARPVTAVPSQQGDVTLVSARGAL